MNLSGIVKAWTFTLASTMLTTGAGFVSSVITARMLGPEGRGLLSTALLIGTLAGNLAQFGLASSYVYHAGAGARFNYARLLAISLLAVLGGASLFSALGLELNGDVRLLAQFPLILGFALLSAAQVYFLLLSQLRANLHFFNAYRSALILGNLVLLLLLRIASSDRVDYRNILATQCLVVAALSIVGTLWAWRHRVWRVDAVKEPVSLRRFLSYGLSHYVTSLLYLAMQNVDKLLILHLVSTEGFAYYTLAFTTSRIIGSPQDSLSTALFSRYVGKDRAELASVVGMAFRLTFLPLFLAASAIAALSHPLIVLVYGASFAPMAQAFSLLLLECVVSAASFNLSQLFSASGRPNLALLREAAATLPMAICAPLLSKDNAFELIPWLMLGSAVVRLLVTFILFRFTLKQAWPSILPKRADYQSIKNVVLSQMAITVR